MGNSSMPLLWNVALLCLWGSASMRSLISSRIAALAFEHCGPYRRLRVRHALYTAYPEVAPLWYLHVLDFAEGAVELAWLVAACMGAVVALGVLAGQ